MRQKNVVIVKEGTYGGVKQEDYDEIAEIVRRVLEGLTRKNSSNLLEEEKVFASVEVVNTAEDARNKSLNNLDILIFLTLAKTEVARAIKKERPQTDVIIYTGLIPDDEIIWINKGWPLEVLSGIVSHL